MQFIFSIESYNAALVDDPNTEIARLLRKTADKVERDEMDGVLLDLNGGTVGSFTYNES